MILGKGFYSANTSTSNEWVVLLIISHFRISVNKKYRKEGKIIWQGSYAIYEKLRDWQEMQDSDVARELQMRQGFLSEWKNGKCHPNVDKLKRISQIFGVHIEDLLEDTM